MNDRTFATHVALATAQSIASGLWRFLVWQGVVLAGNFILQSVTGINLSYPVLVVTALNLAYISFIYRDIQQELNKVVNLHKYLESVQEAKKLANVSEKKRIEYKPKKLEDKWKPFLDEDK